MELVKRISWPRASGYAALISLGFLIAFGLLALIGPVTFGRDAPAWVQAIGSIAAILIAVAVPAVQHWLSGEARRTEALDRARSLGLQLLPDIQSYSDTLDAVWAKEHPEDDVADYGENACFLGPVARSALDIPDGIASQVGRLHELGPAAEGLQRAVYNVSRASEMLTTVVVTSESPFGPNIEHRRLIANKDAFYDLLWNALNGLTTSQNRIEAFFEGGAARAKRPK